MAKRLERAACAAWYVEFVESVMIPTEPKSQVPPAHDIRRKAGAGRRCRRRARPVDRGIGLDHPRQTRPLVADIAHVEQQIAGERRWTERFQFCAYGGRMPFSTVSTVVGCGNELGANGFCPFQGSVKLIGAVKLPGLRPRQRAERRLQRAADAVRERVIENAVRARESTFYPNPVGSHARPTRGMKAFPVNGRDAVGHAGIAGKQQIPRARSDKPSTACRATTRSCDCGCR